MHGRQSQPAHTVSGVLTALLTRRWVRLLLSAVLLASILGTLAWVVVPALASRDTAATVSYYGANNSLVKAAVNAAGWPQQKNNWCGVATIAAIARYRGHAVSQTAVANFLNSSAAVSEWGTPTPTTNSFGPGFKADIALDVGTDPRSLAEGLTAEAQGSYHQLVDPGTNYKATVHLVEDLMHSGQPISVIVFHGLHSVLVSAVAATANPLTHFSSVLGLDVWDPGYGIPNGNIQAAQEEFVPLNTWLTSPYYWGSVYSGNYYGSIPDDPDPSVGPYAYNLGVDLHLWITHFVYLRPDASTASDISVSADWAVSPSGALIVGEHGEVPEGYTGARIVLPVISHLTYTSSVYTSIDTPALWTNSTYPPVQSNPILPVSVLAWAGTASPHLLTVSPSWNGTTYGDRKTVGYGSFTRPSVLVVPTKTGWVIDLAFVGTSSPHYLNVLSNVYGSDTRLTLPATSSYAPSLAYFGGQVWIAWIGTDSAHTVNVQPLGATGLTPGARSTLSFAHSTQAPNLSNDAADGKLLLSWEDSAGAYHLDSASSSSGVTWTQGVESSSTLASRYTPPLVEGTFPSTSTPPTQVEYAWCWTVEDEDHSVDIMSLAALTTWSGPVTTLLISSLGAPALGYIGANQELLLAWTQTTGRGIDIAILPANG